MNDCCCNLVGVLDNRGRELVGVLSGAGGLVGSLELPTAVAPVYSGTYEVTPTAHHGVILDTQGKKMIDNVTVFEIPYYLTTNLSGGYTAIIG